MIGEFHPNGWVNFVDAWAQYHRVSMTEEARTALCNAFSNLSGQEVEILQSTPVAPRYLTPDGTIVHSPETTMGEPRARVPTRPVTHVVKGAPVSINPEHPATRIVRRTPPATSVPPTPERSGRILRTPRKG